MVNKKDLLSILMTAHRWLDFDENSCPNDCDEIYKGAHKALQALEEAINKRLLI